METSTAPSGHSAGGSTVGASVVGDADGDNDGVVVEPTEGPLVNDSWVGCGVPIGVGPVVKGGSVGSRVLELGCEVAI